MIKYTAMQNKFSAVSLCALLAIMLIVAPQQGLAQKKKDKKKGRPPAVVELATVIERNISASINLTGAVQALTESVVAAEVNGRVIKFSKKEGDEVKRNETVALLDRTSYRIILRGAKGQLVKAEIALERARLAAKRAKELFEQKIASEEVEQNAELDVKMAEAEIMLRKADLEQAEYNLARCEVRAPYNGFVARKLTDVGNWVNDGDGLFEIIDIHRIEVVVEAPERYLREFSMGREAQVTLDAYPGKTFKGKIAAVSPKADLKSRTFRVKVGMDNPNSAIKAGMLARVTVTTSEQKDVVLIPRDAIVWRARRAMVFTVNEGKAKSAIVTIGRQQGAFVEASGAIKRGMKLIVTGNEILRDGSPVNVVGEKSYK
ncbi:hypothetical protein MNBD_NITROSPINAE04-1835 [hydrothermal vent metagenome]|uniref:Uncharacterized protein n=1 Tax=hydrothermal vent metagenome TaxID=652676 RepID=A0A3B1D7S8_9ZZZZ